MTSAPKAKHMQRAMDQESINFAFRLERSAQAQDIAAVHKNCVPGRQKLLEFTFGVCPCGGVGRGQGPGQGSSQGPGLGWRTHVLKTSELPSGAQDIAVLIAKMACVIRFRHAGLRLTCRFCPRSGQGKVIGKALGKAWAKPSGRPSANPSAQHSATPLAKPLEIPSASSSAMPSVKFWAKLSQRPSAKPSEKLSAWPSDRLAARFFREPSAKPSEKLSAIPSAKPSAWSTLTFWASPHIN